MTVFRTSMRNFWAHKGRMALSAVAVLLSVAFVCGTLVFTDTMSTTFDKLFAKTAADVTVSPSEAARDRAQTGSGATLPAAEVAKLGRVDGVARAEGAVSTQSVTVVGADNKSLGAATGAPTIAGNWTRTDEQSMELTSGHLPRSRAEVVVDADTAKKHHLRTGDAVRTITAHGDFTSHVSGVAAFTVTNPGAAVFYYDTATAQRELLGAPGRFTQINLTAAKGVSDTALKADASAVLGEAGHKLLTRQESADEYSKDTASFLDVLKYALLGFAGIAFLVGIFLIVNTFSMLVAQRTRELGLLRAVGSSRRQVNRSVLVEALLLGAVGSVLGVGAGVGLAVGLMKLMNAAGLNLSTNDLTIAWTTPVIGLVLGVAVTVLAAYLPARRAGRVSPMAALRETGSPTDRRAGAVRSALGAVLTLGGAAALHQATTVAKAGDGAPWLGGGIFLSLLGLILVGPLLAGLVVRVIGAVVLRVFGPMGRLAERNALRNPRRTGATGAALMIGLALVACLSVVGSSMVTSASAQLDESVGADFIVDTMSQPLVPEAEKAVAGIDGIAHVSHLKRVGATVTFPDGRRSHDGLSATEPTYQEDVHQKTVSGSLAAAYERDGMSLNEGAAEKYGVKVGDKLAVAFHEGATARLTVRAITSDETVFDKGAWYVSLATARAHLPAGKVPPSVALFAKADDGKQKAVYADLKRALDPYPQYEVANQADYKQLLKDQVGQLLNMIYGLLALAIVVAVLGVVNTLALSVVERTREIGLMRAIGLSRRQLRRVIRLESVVIALFGAALGLGLGLGWGASAQSLLALEGLKVLDIPWATIGGVFAGSALVGLLAALVPAFRAGRMNVLGAIATE
ncbi:FtsX-like permease family protein [Streptomyces sp. NPDC004959]|uniref:ABC transporter permease n=1 Tax=unclassified Streptomyces TaxID=2593676 RepID=UPI0004C4D7DA|nr:FtsX-like permease family protein [Streptomyces sp. NRRL F-5630]